MDYILLIVGFIFLIKGADIFVDGASSIARKFKIPAIIVGLTIVSLGTSAPELAVSTISSLNNSNGIAIGNILGSNIFNTLVVLGATAIMAPIIIKKSIVYRDYMINIGVSILLLILTFGRTIFNGYVGLSRLSGIILIIGCIAFTIYLIKTAKSENEYNEESNDEKEIKVIYSCGLILVGIIGIVLGGNLVVNSASNIAYSFGLSEKLVGLTIVAIGTSLPELVTSVMAAKKGENDIAIGNVLGSNIFNILLILGVSSTINPIIISSSLFIDMIFLIFVSLLLGILMFRKKSSMVSIGRKKGLILLGIYVLYMIYIILRN